MSEKKVIEQDDRYAVQVEHTDDSVILMQGDDLYANGIGINKPKATEVAKAIDPRYQLMEDALRDVQLCLESQLYNDEISRGVLSALRQRVNQALNHKP